MIVSGSACEYVGDMVDGVVPPSRDVNDVAVAVRELSDYVFSRAEGRRFSHGSRAVRLC